MNRLYNCSNPYQGDYKKVLCVCSAGLLRSPTAALVLSQPPYNYNTRACGIDKGHALVPIDEVLVAWADEIVTMNKEQVDEIWKHYPLYEGEIVSLDIPDSYRYRDPELIKLIEKRYAGSLIVDEE